MRRAGIVLALLAGVLLSSTMVIYGFWLNRVRLAEKSFAQAQYQEAQEKLKRAWSGWELAFLPGSLVRETQAHIALNLIQVGYVLEEYEQTMEFLQDAVVSLPSLHSPEYHFWLGNLTMQRALNNPDTNLIDALTRCKEEYLETLRAAPQLWDAKYNYEYVNMLLEQLQKSGSDGEMEFKLLLEKVRTDIQRRKKELPPQKRG